MTHQTPRKPLPRALSWGALALVLIGAGALALHLRDLDAQARIAAVRALESGLGLKAKIERAELSLLRGELLASGVELRDAHGRLVASARELRLAGSWTGLLRGRVDLQSVQLNGARVQLGEAELRALEAAAKRDARPPFTTLEVTDSALAVELPGLGKIELEALRLQLQAQPARLQLKLDAPRARFALPGEAPLVLGALHVAGTGDARGLQLSEAQLTRGKAKVVFADARLRFPLGDEASARIDVDGELGELLALWPAATRPALAGKLKLVGSLGRTQGRWSGEGRLALGAISLRGTQFATRTELSYKIGERGIALDGRLERGNPVVAARLQTELRIAGAALELSPLAVSAGQSTLTGKAAVDDAGALALELAADDARVGDVASLLGLDPARVPLDGRGKLALRAHGAPAAPALALELNLHQASVAGVALGSLNATLELAGGGSELRVVRASAAERTRTIATEGLRLRWPGGALEASGKVALNHVPLADLYSALGVRDDVLLSRLQADARGQLELSRAGASQKLGLTLDLSQPSLDGRDFDAGKLDAQITLFDGAQGAARSALELAKLELRSGAGKLALSGKVARGGALDLRVALDGLPLSRIAANGWPWSSLEGTARGEGSFSGSTQDPRARFALELDDLRFGGIGFGRQPLRAELTSGKGGDTLAGCETAARGGGINGASWRLCGGRGGVELDLALGSGQGRPMRGRLEVEGADISAWLPDDRGGDPLPGSLSGALAIDGGGLSSPETLSGRVDVRVLALGKGSHALRAAAPFALRIARGAVTVENGSLVGDRVQLKLGAQGTLPNVRLTADGTVAVNPLARAGVVPLVSEAYGEVGVHAELAPGRRPLLRAVLELRDVIAHVGGDALVVKKVKGAIAVEDQRATLKGLTGELGGGTLELGGEMELTGLSVTRYDLTLGANKVALEPQPRFNIAFDAQARLESGKNGKPPKVTGTFKVAKLVYGRNIQLPEALVAMNRSDRSTRAAYAPARDRLLVDIAIEHSQPLVVRNNFLDAELSLRGAERTLRVVGSDQRFGLLGELAVDRGRVLYRGDEFQIARGAVSFADPERVDPVFDLRAIAQKRSRPDASIVFSARGDRDAFQIDVRCDTDNGTAPEPFECDFAHDKLRCDQFDELVQQFACRPKTELSSAGQ